MSFVGKPAPHSSAANQAPSCIHPLALANMPTVESSAHTLHTAVNIVPLEQLWTGWFGNTGCRAELGDKRMNKCHGDKLTLTYRLTSPCPVCSAPGCSSVTAVEPATPVGFDWETNRAGGLDNNRGKVRPNRGSRLNILSVCERQCWPGTGNKIFNVSWCIERSLPPPRGGGG